MNRKTNLFYNFGNDSNFLTFSNYTEALTGNFISTNTKLFPSKFLCINVPSIKDEENRKEFIKDFLCGYYENKLAFLRDKIIEYKKQQGNTSYTVESFLSSLGYLIDCIYKYDENSQIVYVGDITEQDFNGTYTDTICVIDTQRYKTATPIKNENTLSKLYPYIDAPMNDYLYGWYNSIQLNNLDNTGYDEIKEIHPIFDSENYYNSVSEHSYLELNNVSENDKDIKSIEFNILIPLFDIINIDATTNIETIKEISKIGLESEKSIDDEDIFVPPYISNVPLGIWFAPNCENIILKRDTEKSFAQSWSLVIGSQFKPFPYMTEMPNEINRDGIAAAYSTFSQIMSNQNAISENILKLTASLVKINEKISKIEKTINECPEFNNNMDNIRKEFLDYKGEVSEIINSFRSELDSTQLKWINREG